MPECDISRIRAEERKNHLQTIVSVKRTRARKKKGATAGLSKNYDDAKRIRKKEAKVITQGDEWSLGWFQ